MRLAEALRLRVKDIDFGYDQITVRDGKGAKDRMTMLPTSLKAELQEHLKGVKKLHETTSSLAAAGSTIPMPWPGNILKQIGSGAGSSSFRHPPFP